MYRRQLQLAHHAARRGSLLPGIALAILVCGSCLALVLNEYWLAGAYEELRTATQTAALAAAGELVDDDLLRTDSDPLRLSRKARLAGERQASRNSVAGPQAAKIDIHLGRVIFDPLTGQQQTLETDYSPNAVIAVGHRDRSRANPVQILAPVLTGYPVADVKITVEASLSNLIEGVRPFGAADVPGWPIAILERSSDPRIDSWIPQIEERQGSDILGWDDKSKSVVNAADGLPEIKLLPKVPKGINNVFLVNTGNDLQDAAVTRQFRDGWSAADLSPFGEVFTLKPGPISLSASDDFSGAPYDAMKSQIGQVRIILLYSMLDQEQNGDVSVQVTRMVAARLMKVSQGQDGPEFIMQPAVIVTRTAVLDEDALYAGETFGNPYIYKISLTQ